MSRTDNYFKVLGHTFFFVSSIPESIEEAFELANLLGDPCIYTPVSQPGEWDFCNVIGHRSYGEIDRDLKNETNEEDLALLHDEMQALKDCFDNVGRQLPAAA